MLQHREDEEEEEEGMEAGGHPTLPEVVQSSASPTWGIALKAPGVQRDSECGDGAAECWPWAGSSLGKSQFKNEIKTKTHRKAPL